MIYGMKLKQLRAERGWTQEQVARAVPCTTTTIAYAEQGRVQRPSSAVARRLAEIFDVDESEFTGTPAPLAPDAVAA